MISSAFAQVLQARRAELNARFHLGRQRFPRLDTAAFSRFLSEAVDPVIVAVHAYDRAAVDRVVSVAYDCALQLAGHGVTGESARAAAIVAGWRNALAAAAAHVAAAPETVLPAVTNALHGLYADEDCDIEQWQHGLRSAVAHCRTPDEFLSAGQVLAWQGGLAHFRDAALHLLQRFPQSLSAHLLSVEEARLPSVLARLTTDPWFDPARGSAKAAVIRRIGAFRGFGGSFLQLPLVRAAANGWMVRSGDEHWFLVADAFGATFHRASDGEWSASGAGDPVEHVGMRLRYGGTTIELADAGPITSSAARSGAIACTFAHSYQIALVSQIAAS
jgi:hypothetical protein